MAVKIPPAQIQNLQQIEVVVAGPNGADRLLTIDGQFDSTLDTSSVPSQKETFTILVGPVLTRKQFFRASATASLTKTSLNVNRVPFVASWQILSVDADWDDESGQVELRIEAEVDVFGAQGNNVSIFGIGFHVTILAAAAAA